MKKLLWLFIVFLILFLGGGGYYALLTDNISQAKFRKMQDPISDQGVNVKGLKELKASGSPSFYFKDLKTFLADVQNPIIIVDGQREDHGYIGTIPTVFFGYERKPDLRHFIRRFIFTGRTDVCESCVISEKELVEKKGFQYQNIKIDSKIRTPDSTVDDFVKFVDSLPPEVWVHFHCRLGKGRTSMMLIMFDTMHNAPEVALDDIVKRQHLLGSENLFNTVARHGGTYHSSTLLRRKKFIEDFYDFICQRKAGGIQRWSDWRRRQK